MSRFWSQLRSRLYWSFSDKEVTPGTAIVPTPVIPLPDLPAPPKPPVAGTMSPFTLAPGQQLTIGPLASLVNVTMTGGSVFPAGTVSTTSVVGIGPETPVTREHTLPVVRQDDLIKGTKYAVLSIDKKGKPCFRGVGYTEKCYYTETYAECGRRHPHPVPDEDCTCGFWVPLHPRSRLTAWSSGRVALEVEMAGKILECWPDEQWKGSVANSGRPWGWRAEWQRVLSVTLHATCEMKEHARVHVPCMGDPKYLCQDRDYVNGIPVLKTACDVHVDYQKVIERPVSWLRECLQTEIRPGTVTDASPPPLPELPSVEGLDAAWREETKRIIDAMVPTSMLSIPQPTELGQWFVTVHDGVSYAYEATMKGWEIKRISTPLLDQLTAAIAAQENLSKGLITARAAMELMKQAFDAVKDINAGG